ncbi:MAG: hypothetical protein ACI8RE_003201 [Ilumatobacter sp.]|jgi:hypothetical protein
MSPLLGRNLRLTVARLQRVERHAVLHDQAIEVRSRVVPFAMDGRTPVTTRRSSCKQAGALP